MADLKDGESIAMHGSGSRPYQLKNTGGVYSCSCPAWRHQSLPIEQRTCKHLRRLRGDEAESTRVGAQLPHHRSRDESRATSIPALLLAQTWDGESDLAGWWMSEKLDGVRAYWTGDRLVSRLGNPIHAPAWFTAGLPATPLDGELWMARKRFQRTVGIVRRQDQPDAWKEIRYLIFDAPDDVNAFEHRVKRITQIVRDHQPPFAAALEHSCCVDTDHMRRELARVDALGGEGLMLRQPGSRYIGHRSSTLLKVKSFSDAEARVVGHEPGQGRHKGRLGALLCELPNGKRFAVGTGLSDAERACPPLIGSWITFRYQELTDGGVPRFPSYVGIRAGINQSLSPSPASQGPAVIAKSTAATKRRFEFVQGASDKFWEISIAGREVTVRFGRNGAAGQVNVKAFADAAAANQHANTLIAAKTGKGYVEVR